MAEFCLECWNRMMNTNDSAKKYILSQEADLCEGCGKGKPVIIRAKRWYDFRCFFERSGNDTKNRRK